MMSEANRLPSGRSKRFDPRNKAGKLTSVYPGTLGDYLSYSSIILDAVKDRS